MNPGDKYRHYKGGIYTVTGIASHTETGEQLVIYQGKDDQLWARPYEMFTQPVLVNGTEVSRFKLID